MYRGILNIIVLISFAVIPTSVNAQTFPSLKLFPVHTGSSSPAKKISDIAIDQQGLMWFSTEAGELLRYDGNYTKVVISPDQSNASLHELSIDNKNQIYISSADGLVCYNPVTDKLKRYRHNENDNSSLADDDKPNAFVDSKQRVWVTSAKGLQQLDAMTGRFVSYHTPAIPATFPQKEFNHLEKIAEDQQGNLWIASAYGLYKIDTVEKKLIPYYFSHYTWITGIFIDAQHQFWLTTWGTGMIKFNPASGQFTDLHSPELSNKIIYGTCEYEDINQKRWFCFSDYESLILMDPATKKTKQYFVGTRINNFYKDKNNRLWLATTEGLFIVDNLQQQITAYPLYQLANVSEGAFGLPRFWFDTGNEIWLTNYYAKGLNKFTKDFKFIAHSKSIPPNSKSNFSSIINVIVKDKKQNIWYSTDSGLVKQTGNSFHVLMPLYGFNKEKGTSFKNILQRTDGKWWISSYWDGMSLFDPEKETFEKIEIPKEVTVVTASALDKLGRLWIGTDKGLYLFNDENKMFISFYMHYPNGSSDRLWNQIFDLLPDNNKRIWLATQAGITVFDEDKIQFTFLNEQSGLGYTPTYRLLQDDNHFIWVVAHEKLIAINSENWKLQTFGNETGLPTGFDDFGLFRKDVDGNIWLAYNGGLTKFDPKKLLTGSTEKGKIIITDVYEDGERKIFNNDSTFEVNKNSTLVRIRFAYNNYSISEKNILYYKISQQGLNTNWQKSNGEISLVNLTPGTYTLQLKGENSSLNQSPVITSFTIVIPPKWYQTLLFKILLLLFAIGIIYFLIRWRIRNIKFKAALQQKISESEMGALKAQMNPHFMFNCINSIDSFIYSNDKYNATLYLNKFAKLLRNILDNSKENTVLLSKDIETLKLYIEMEELRHEGKFTTHFNIEKELESSSVIVPPLIIQPFVENAILHGLRNKINNDGILTISIKKSNDCIEYIITDNGIGRQKAALLNVNKPSSHGMKISFDRIRLFNQEENHSVIIKDRVEGDGESGSTVIVSLKTKYRYD